jgi:hypothetical protein
MSTLLTFSGCTEVGPFREILPFTRVISFGYHSPATHKLKSARVMLANNQTTYINIRKSELTSFASPKPKIDASDNLRAQQYLNAIQKSLVAKTKEELFRSGVVEGDEMILELTITEGYYNTNDRSGNVVVKTTVKRPGAPQDIWNISILSYSPDTANHDVLLNNFASKLVSELKTEGWL